MKRRDKRKRVVKVAFLFDLDGTLVDTVYDHVSTWSTTLRQARLAVSDWEIHRHVGMNGASMLRQVLHGRTSIDKIDIDALEKKRDVLFTKINHPRQLPGAGELLAHLSNQKIQWAIATTGNRKQTHRFLKTLKVPADIPIITGDDVKHAKPAPDVFMEAAHRLHVQIENCLIVGDSIWDMIGATRMRALGVGLLSGGYGKEELLQAGAFRVYEDPMDMLRHIEDFGIMSDT